MATGVVNAQVLTNAFTYQGVLRGSGGLIQTMVDFEFKIFDAAAGENQVGPTLVASTVTMDAGLFAVSMDFNAGVFSGQQRWIEIGVRNSMQEAKLIRSRNANR